MVVPLVVGAIAAINFLGAMSNQRAALKQQEVENQRKQEAININKAIAFSNMSSLPAGQRKAVTPMAMQMLGIDPKSAAAKSFTSLMASDDEDTQAALKVMAGEFSSNPNQIDAITTLMQKDPAEFIRTMTDRQYKAVKAQQEELKAASTNALNLARSNQANAMAQATRAKVPSQVAASEGLAVNRQQRAALVSIASGAKLSPDLLGKLGLSPDMTPEQAKELLKNSSNSGGGIDLGSLVNPTPSSSRGEIQAPSSIPSLPSGGDTPRATDSLDNIEQMLQEEIRKLQGE